MQKILIIRFSSIGDIVLTSPVVRCIDEQIPDVQIHYLTKPAFANILLRDKRIHRVWEWSDQADNLLKELKAESFDFIVDLHHNLRSWRVKRVLNCPSKSFQKLNFQKYLKVNFGINVLPKEHIVDRYLKTVEVLGVQNDKKGLDFFLQSEDEIVPKSITEIIKTPFVALAIGAMHATKQMPLEKLDELISLISYPIILLGGLNDKKTGEQLQIKFPTKVLNACGAVTLGQSAFITSKSSVLITHDTGMMHIGAALKRPIISIWGNTIPEFGMSPYMPGNSSVHYEMEVKGLSCRPCSKIGHKACPKKHFRCMNLQDSREISRITSRIINHQSNLY